MFSKELKFPLHKKINYSYIYLSANFQRPPKLFQMEKKIASLSYLKPQSENTLQEVKLYINVRCHGRGFGEGEYWIGLMSLKSLV